MGAVRFLACAWRGQLSGTLERVDPESDPADRHPPRPQHGLRQRAPGRAPTRQRRSAHPRRLRPSQLPGFQRLRRGGEGRLPGRSDHAGGGHRLQGEPRTIRSAGSSRLGEAAPERIACRRRLLRPRGDPRRTQALPRMPGQWQADGDPRGRHGRPRFDLERAAVRPWPGGAAGRRAHHPRLRIRPPRHLHASRRLQPERPGGDAPDRPRHHPRPPLAAARCRAATPIRAGGPLLRRHGRPGSMPRTIPRRSPGSSRSTRRTRTTPRPTRSS